MYRRSFSFSSVACVSTQPSVPRGTPLAKNALLLDRSWFMRIVIGVDACEGGWVFIQLVNGVLGSARFYQDFATGVDSSLDSEVIGVDILIGYPRPAATQRLADVQARAMVGPRRASVFPAPHPDVLGEQNWADANRMSRKRFGRGLTKQSFALKPKINEVADVTARDNRVYEVHPEVSFVALAGQHLEGSKKQWNGHNARRALLAAHGIVIPDDLGNVGSVGADDVLDAAAAAWSALASRRERRSRCQTRLNTTSLAGGSQSGIRAVKNRDDRSQEGKEVRGPCALPRGSEWSQKIR